MANTRSTIWKRLKGNALWEWHADVGGDAEQQALSFMDVSRRLGDDHEISLTPCYAGQVVEIVVQTMG